jgi:hypothetical protein
MRLSPNEMAWCLQTAGFAGADVITGIAVGIAESGGETDVIGSATSGTTNNRDHGVWQISNRWHGAKMQKLPDWRDPLVNAKLAKQVFDETVRAGKVGWTAWAVYNSGSYEPFLEAAKIGVQAPFKPAYPPWLLDLTHQRVMAVQTGVDELPDLIEFGEMFANLSIKKQVTETLGFGG